MKKVIPISDFFLKDKQKTILLEKGDIFEIRDRKVPIPKLDEYFYHSLLNILEPINKETKESLVEKSKYNITNFSCHLLTSYKRYDIVKHEDYEILKGKGVTYKPYECLDNVYNNIDILKEIFGDIEISVENTGYLFNEDDFAQSPYFIYDIVKATKVTFLFDIAHAFVSKHNMKHDEHINKLPLEHTNYIHISNYKIKDGIAYDTHDGFDKPYLKNCLDTLNDFDIQYINIEYYKDFSTYLNLLEMLEDEIHERDK